LFLKILVVWDMTCHWANGSWYFQGTVLWNVGRCLPSDTVSCPRRCKFTSVSWPTQCSSPADLNIHRHYCESLRSHISKAVVVIKEYYSAFVHCEGFRSYIM